MYTSIVRKTQDPALLEYVGSDLLSLKIFPIPAKGDQKVEVSITAVAEKEHELVEYLYPLKTDRNAVSTLEEFRITLTLSSQQPISSIYSPTHEVSISQDGDHEAVVKFEKLGAQLDTDFQLFYTTSGQDIGLTTLEHRPVSTEDGYVMMLISPRAELSQTQKVPRDIVFVLDTSGSMMQDKKMDQAKNALLHCLDGLSSDDRFALINFATTVNRYRDELVSASDEQVKSGKGWVNGQYAGGGTAINEALKTALDLRSNDDNRMFTVVFFTDGQPTIGETDTDNILAAVAKQNTTNTRIFTFGLGDNLNAAFLDQIAEQTRAVSSYVRPEQDIEVKVSAFFNKIHHPVLSNLKLTTTSDVRLTDVYPPQIPDLFHGDQLVVLARYQGSGHSAIVLDGKVGPHDKQFVYELDFRAQTNDKPFVEELWARRKVGYLLDQIRINGEKKELVDEVVRLATNYGITTPYTSFLIMPDAPVQLTANGAVDSMAALGRRTAPAALAPAKEGAEQQKVADFARLAQQEKGQLATNRGRFQDREFSKYDGRPAAKPSAAGTVTRSSEALRQLNEAKRVKGQLDLAFRNYRSGNLKGNQVLALGVDVAINTNTLKSQCQLQAKAIRKVNSRNCMEIGGVWIDEDFTEKTRTVAIKAQSDAYFQILEKQPQMKEVFQLGNHIVWITPNGTGLVIDTTDGQERISDKDIAMLFASK